MILKYWFNNFFLFSLILFSSCNNNLVRVQVDNISKEFLASYHVGTPDPRLLNPPIGQRLTLSWYFPFKVFEHSNIKIKIYLHFGDHTMEEIEFFPKRNSGFYLYSLINNRYYEKKGLLTYKVEVFQDEIIIKECRHQLWVELISM